MPDRGDVQNPGQVSAYGTPMQAPDVPRNTDQHSISLSADADSSPDSQLGLSHHFPDDSIFQRGTIQLRIISQRALHNQEPSKTSHALGASSSDRSEDDSDHHHVGEGKNEHAENVELVPWIKLAIEGAHNIVAVFPPLKQGSLGPLLNLFWVEHHSGVLNQRPNQSIYYRPGRPTDKADCRQCVSPYYFPRRRVFADFPNLSQCVGMWMKIIRRCTFCYQIVSWYARAVLFYHISLRRRIS